MVVYNEVPPHTTSQDAMPCYAKSLQSCPTLCDPIDSSPPGSPVPGILKARTLEWVAISFSNAWKWRAKVKSLSHVWLSDPMDCSLPPEPPSHLPPYPTRFTWDTCTPVADSCWCVAEVNNTVVEQLSSIKKKEKEKKKQLNIEYIHHVMTIYHWNSMWHL